MYARVVVHVAAAPIAAGRVHRQLLQQSLPRLLLLLLSCLSLLPIAVPQAAEVPAASVLEKGEDSALAGTQAHFDAADRLRASLAAAVDIADWVPGSGDNKKVNAAYNAVRPATLVMDPLRCHPFALTSIPLPQIPDSGRSQHGRHFQRPRPRQRPRQP
jgi:hypothetical protein